MARKSSPALTDAEARVMAVVWQQAARHGRRRRRRRSKKHRPVSTAPCRPCCAFWKRRATSSHDKVARAFVYRPVVDERQARRRALRHLIATAVQQIAEPPRAERAGRRADRSGGVEAAQEVDRRRVSKGAPRGPRPELALAGFGHRARDVRGTAPAGPVPRALSVRPLRGRAAGRAGAAGRVGARRSRVGVGDARGRPPISTTPVLAIPIAWWTSGVVIGSLGALVRRSSRRGVDRVAAAPSDVRDGPRRPFPPALESRLTFWNGVRDRGRRTRLVLSSGVPRGGRPRLAARR